MSGGPSSFSPFARILLVSHASAATTSAFAASNSLTTSIVQAAFPLLSLQAATSGVSPRVLGMFTLRCGDQR